MLSIKLYKIKENDKNRTQETGKVTVWTKPFFFFKCTRQWEEIKLWSALENDS